MRRSYFALFAYGAMGMPLAALNLPMALYIPTFYASELGLGFGAVGAVIAAARLIDLFTDPVLGAWSDRIRASFGRRKLAILVGIPIMVIASHALFRAAPGSGIVYLFFWCNIAYIGWTLIVLAYSAWGAELSRDDQEKSRIAFSRETAVIIGVMLAAAAPFITSLLPGENIGLRAPLSLIAWGSTFLLLITFTLLWLFVPNDQNFKSKPFAWQHTIKTLVSNRPLFRLLAAHLLNSLANGIPATLFLMFVTHKLDAAQWSGILLLLYFGSGVLCAPLWLQLSYRIGKARAWAASMGWAALMFAMTPFLGPDQLLFFVLIATLSGASLGADLALPASIHADVIEHDEKIAGEQRAGLLFALWGMATKLALALAVFVAFSGLAMAGFDEKAGEGVMALGLIYGALPIPFKFAAMMLVFHFRLKPALDPAS